MKKIYYEIYESLRDKILDGTYPYQSFIPSENVLVEVYECSHNTLRKGLEVLRMHGFVQPIRGKGVRVIYRPHQRANFELGDIETFKEAAERNGLTSVTRVVTFETVVADKALAEKTGFLEGDELHYLERIREFDGVSLIRDKNYFLRSQLPGLTPQIAADSVYAYAEEVLGMDIATSTRTISMQFATPHDKQMLDLLDFDMLAVVTNRTFNTNGVMFESTQSRHRPDFFTFYATAVREY